MLIMKACDRSKVFFSVAEASPEVGLILRKNNILIAVADLLVIAIYTGL